MDDSLQPEQSALIEGLKGDSYAISGEMCFTTVMGLRQQSEAIFTTAGRDLEFDLVGVTRADSAGLALLLEWMRMAANADCGVRYRNIPAQLASIAIACNLPDVLPAAVESGH